MQWNRAIIPLHASRSSGARTGHLAILEPFVKISHHATIDGIDEVDTSPTSPRNRATGERPLFYAENRSGRPDLDIA
jgi:hypothetical protein